MRFPLRAKLNLNYAPDANVAISKTVSVPDPNGDGPQNAAVTRLLKALPELGISLSNPPAPTR